MAALSKYAATGSMPMPRNRLCQGAAARPQLDSHTTSAGRSSAFQSRVHGIADVRIAHGDLAGSTGHQEDFFAQRCRGARNIGGPLRLPAGRRPARRTDHRLQDAKRPARKFAGTYGQIGTRPDRRVFAGHSSGSRKIGCSPTGKRQSLRASTESSSSTAGAPLTPLIRRSSRAMGVPLDTRCSASLPQRCVRPFAIGCPIHGHDGKDPPLSYRKERKATHPQAP